MTYLFPDYAAPHTYKLGVMWSRARNRRTGRVFYRGHALVRITLPHRIDGRWRWGLMIHLKAPCGIHRNWEMAR